MNDFAQHTDNNESSNISITNQDIVKLISEKASEFGFIDKKYALFRESLTSDVKIPYLAFIRTEETDTKYADFSYVIFTDAKSQPDNQPTKLLVTLCVGSMQFKNDASIASRPWWRREFLTLINDDKCFIKSDFSDISERATSIPEEAYEILARDEKYWPLIQAGAVVDVADIYKDIKSVCLQWLACYAGLRGWGAQSVAAKRGRYLPKSKTQNVQKEVRSLLEQYKYVVLQGAPGVGKTFNATKLAQLYADYVFTQFHAETTYTDFIGGLVPDTSSSTLAFKHSQGILIEAIKKALAAPKKKVLLIIDEINRANLANVLGPVFYLFENGAGDRCKISLPEVGELEKLPDNLHVLATMNTADRSLAVVDFALRRRFVWYTIKPTSIKLDSDSEKVFHSVAFEAMAKIFRCYATDSELNLQPGPSYYLTPKDDTDALNSNLTYGVMPLIKEYLSEGYLSGSEEDFAAYFKTYAEAVLFE